MKMNDALKMVSDLVEEKGFPNQEKDSLLLLTRIGIELAECSDAYIKGKEGEAKLELIDVLIQVLQLAGVWGIDIEESFSEVMSKNHSRSFNRHSNYLREMSGGINIERKRKRVHAPY